MTVFDIFEFHRAHEIFPQNICNTLKKAHRREKKHKKNTSHIFRQEKNVFFPWQTTTQNARIVSELGEHIDSEGENSMKG